MLEYAESIRGRGGIRTARTKTSGEHYAMDGKGFGYLSDMGSGLARHPVQFPASATSKRVSVSALRRNRPFDEKDLEELESESN